MHDFPGAVAGPSRRFLLAGAAALGLIGASGCNRRKETKTEAVTAASPRATP
ncbi:hypothetical protein [Brevundimonas sp.]|uniref:hypothetical protein n=1 Tax=Brevundimonas sp. TaxID=1871086 RepID=UPI0025BCB865|nr:hypothetical protein [Brevundimonas sp.]